MTKKADGFAYPVALSHYTRSDIGHHNGVTREKFVDERRADEQRGELGRVRL